MPEPDGRGKRPDWIALPAKSLVSLPMRFHGIDPGRRESAVQLELEAAGLAAESQHPHLFEARVHDDQARDQRAWACVQAAALPREALDGGIDSKFAPSVTFQKLTPGSVTVWDEAGTLAMAIPDAAGNPLHCQALTSREADGDAAAEIRCILAAAELAGASPEVDAVALRITARGEPAGGDKKSDFANALDVPVVEQPPQAPAAPATIWRLAPEPIIQQRAARKQRWTMTLIAASAVLVIAAGLGAFAAGLWNRQNAIAIEQERLAGQEPQLRRIREARDHWAELQIALTPEQYAVELFHQLVLLLPPEGIRLTLFEIGDDKLTIAGEASTVNHAISLREDLAASAAFKDWKFGEGFPSPSVLPDGRAEFHAEGKRPSLTPPVVAAAP